MCKCMGNGGCDICQWRDKGGPGHGPHSFPPEYESNSKKKQANKKHKPKKVVVYQRCEAHNDGSFPNRDQKIMLTAISIIMLTATLIFIGVKFI